MDFDKEHFRDLLIERYVGELTAEEEVLVEKWLLEESEAKSIQEEVDQFYLMGKGRGFNKTINEEIAWLQLSDRLLAKKKRNRIRIISASLVMAALFAVVYFTNFNDLLKSPAHIAANTSSNEVLLTDASGATVALPANVSSDNVIHLNQLVNNVSDAATVPAVSWATIQVPAGKNFTLMLSDSSQVTLNSKSTIRFPYKFNSTERPIYLTGEAFFEVSHQKNRPFKVYVNDKVVEVLGTSFNINAFNTQKVSTSLVQGSVKTTWQNKTITLQPGQEAVYNTNNEIEVKPFDAHETLSWKTGVMYFHNARLADLEPVLLRWFELDVNFSGDHWKNATFSGSIDRNRNIEVFISNLNMTTGWHTRLKGNTLVFE